MYTVPFIVEAKKIIGREISNPLKKYSHISTITDIEKWEFSSRRLVNSNLSIYVA